VRFLREGSRGNEKETVDEENAVENTKEYSSPGSRGTIMYLRKGNSSVAVESDHMAVRGSARTETEE
jgi:hypothetical protein